MKESGLYIHVPYCRRKCIYCDFYSGGERIADYPRYVDAVTEELAERSIELPGAVHTLYIGGGTPSLIPSQEMSRLFREIRKLLGERWKIEELTIEINPDDVTRANVEAWLEMGVNRFSLGIQSLDNKVLGRIGRLHDSAGAIQALEILRQQCDNVSVDVMFGIPGQDMNSWDQTLRELLQHRPNHISCYSLMYEPGTAMTILRDMGRVTEVSDSIYVEMYEHLRTLLEEKGYEAYEISNFALPGFRSRHNGNYWRGYPYLGLGPSAHSYDGVNKRSANPADIRGYLDRYTPAFRCSQTQSLTDSHRESIGSTNSNTGNRGERWERVEETLSDEELYEELVLTRMRTCEGIDLEEVRMRFGPEFENRIIVNARKAIKEGLLTRDKDHLRLTRAGVMISDDIILDLSM